MKKLLVAMLIFSSSLSLFAAPVSEEKTSSSVDKWPSKTIEIVVPASAGGANDLHARTYAKYFEEMWGVPVIVTNMKAGGQAPAYRYVHEAAPDGYTILHTHDAFFINQANGTINFGIDGMTNLGITNRISGQVLVANKNSGWKCLEDAVRAAKEKPNRITVGMSVGSTTQVMANMMIESGIPVKMVDTSGASDRVAQLLGGHIDLAFMGYSDMKQYQESGDFIPLCLLSSEREVGFPDIPTARELGYEVVFDSCFFMLTTPGVDQAIVDKIISAIKEINTKEEYIKDTYTIDQQLPLYIQPEVARTIMDSSLENLRKYSI